MLQVCALFRMAQSPKAQIVLYARKLVLRTCAVARFVINTLDFDTYMSYIQATGADPYVVINYDSANSVWGPKDWTYTQLLALAKSWVSYISRKGYKVRPSGPLCLFRRSSSLSSCLLV